MRVSVLQLPDGLEAGAEALTALAPVLADERSDAVLLNEMPFGPWLASVPHVLRAAGEASARQHAAGFAAIVRDWPGIEVFATRPVLRDGVLENQAIVLGDGGTRPMHVKTKLPEEPGWHERSWFRPGRRPPGVFENNGLRMATLICSELMYTELARALLHERVEIILAPRATGGKPDHWMAAARMAAVWSGAYVLSSNRVSPCGTFGGVGFAIAPDGALIGVTSAEKPLLTVTIDRDCVARNRRRYPCTMELTAEPPAIGRGRLAS